jgi:hypothetical protein
MALHSDAGVADYVPAGVGAKSPLTSTAHVKGHGSPFVTTAKSSPSASAPKGRITSFGRCS